MSAILGLVVADDTSGTYAATCLRFSVTTSGRSLDEALDNLRGSLLRVLESDQAVDKNVLLLVTVRTAQYESVIAEPLFTAVPA